MELFVKYRRFFVAFFLLCLMGLAFYIRTLAYWNFPNANPVDFLSMDDPLYNLRLVEQMLTHQTYPWFDPMTYYPYGSVLNWGPLFTIISTMACVVTGAVTRPDIIKTVLFIPPILAVCIIPVAYYIGKSLMDWKAGVFAALFTTFIAGQFFYRSMYGYFDHHIAEALFGSLFCLIYITVASTMRQNDSKKNYILPIFSGVAYTLGFLIMPTMILFAFIAGIFTVVQSIIDVKQNRSFGYLVALNGITFFIPIVAFSFFGPIVSQLALDNYSMIHPLVYMLIIFGTLLLYQMRQYLRVASRWGIYTFYIGALAAISFTASAILVPEFLSIMSTYFIQFFGQNSYALTVQEARYWTVSDALNSFNVALPLSIIGFGYLVYKTYKESSPSKIFFIIWSVVIFGATIQHIRYEYYAAVNIAILTGIFVSVFVMYCLPDVVAYIRGKTSTVQPVEPKQLKKKQQKKQSARVSEVRKIESTLFLAGIVVITGFFIISSLAIEVGLGSAVSGRMNHDWVGAAEWMSKNTPETGVNYSELYKGDGFKYPNQSYGVLSWWDYGHVITFFGNRIPNANPFQSGVQGQNGSAAFFMQEDEKNATKILDNIGTKYIVTDVEMSTGKFWAMSTWYDKDVAGYPYQPIFLAQESASSPLKQVQFFSDKYYQTMVTRLHNFDGSFVTPSTVVYLELTKDSKYPIPLIARGMNTNATTARVVLSQFNQGYQSGTEVAGVYNIDPTLSTVEIDALRHFRLVYESPTSTIGTIRYVKIFEYVKGAEIRGEGTIEIYVTTNTGRTFVYKQKSINGTFVVPYSTDGCPYAVKATGPYNINGTNFTFEISENDIINGFKVQ